MFRRLQSTLWPLWVAVMAWAAFAQSPRLPAIDGFSMTASVQVPTDGTEVALPALKDPTETAYRVVLAGTFTFDHDGRTYDARQAVTETGESAPHPYVVLSHDLPLTDSVPGRHWYTFAADSDMAGQGESITARIDVDRFVDDFLITPSEVRRQLHGALTLELHEHSLVAPSLLRRIADSPILLACTGLALAILLATIGSSIVRYSDELTTRQRRIDHKHRHLRRAAAAGGEFFGEMVRQLDELRASADRIAGDIRQTRRAVSGSHKTTLVHGVSTLERRLAAADDPAVRKECEAALAERRRALETLIGLEARVEQAFMRLSKVEAVLDSIALRLPEMALALRRDAQEDAAIADLNDELDLVRDTLDDVKRTFPDE